VLTFLPKIFPTEKSSKLNFTRVRKKVRKNRGSEKKWKKWGPEKIEKSPVSVPNVLEGRFSGGCLKKTKKP
jgi:hypothetical protein